MADKPKPDWAAFKEKLEQEEWPSIYPFKFIAPIECLGKLTELFEKADTTTRVSKKGNYVSVTARPFMPNADSVIEKYKLVGEMEGVISL